MKIEEELKRYNIMKKIKFSVLMSVYKNDNHAVYAYIGTMDSGTNHSISISVQDKNYFNHNSGVNGSNATLHVRCILAF